MNNTELSREFDILYNSVFSNRAPGLDEYEKSVLLTYGQYDVIRSYFNNRKNKVQQGFDDSKQRQADFSSLIKTVKLDKSHPILKFDRRSVSYRTPNDLLVIVNERCEDAVNRYTVTPITYMEYDRLMLKPYQYPLKREVWRLVVDSTSPEVSSLEDIKLSICNSSNKEVTFIIHKVSKSIDTVLDGDIPMSIQDIGEAPIITEMPDKITIECNISDKVVNTSRYWSVFLRGYWNDRIKLYVGDFNSAQSSFPAIPIDDLGNSISVTAHPATPYVELIGKVDKESLDYTIRYVRKPRPIILTDLDEGLSIQGISTETSCELDESLQYDVLQRAVELAKSSYLGDLQSQLVLGQASKTDIGVLQSNK